MKTPRQMKLLILMFTAMLTVASLGCSSPESGSTPQVNVNVASTDPTPAPITTTTPDNSLVASAPPVTADTSTGIVPSGTSGALIGSAPPKTATQTPAKTESVNGSQQQGSQPQGSQQQGNQPEAAAPKAGITSGANDFWIFTSTRAALDSADKERNANIVIDVRNNVVTLTGNAADADHKARVEQVVRGVAGVKEVKNTLRIAPR